MEDFSWLFVLMDGSLPAHLTSLTDLRCLSGPFCFICSLNNLRSFLDHPVQNTTPLSMSQSFSLLIIFFFPKLLVSPSITLRVLVYDMGLLPATNKGFICSVLYSCTVNVPYT